MNIDAATLKEIDDYLSGELTNEQKAEFEKRIAAHQDLREDVELVDRLIEGIQGYGFKQMLKRIHAKHFGKDSTASDVS
jgi:anti-sigma factor RsiW